MNQLLNYKTVITGSSEGIGFGIAEAFARNGADV
jgi:NAD(P)-dependent dehydrogenase (short-subunit alcohol dehydrogenase family)